MTIVAPASSSLRTRNWLLVALVGFFAAWFANDGWRSYPAGNDAIVAAMLADTSHTDTAAIPLLQDYQKKGGWNGADSDLKKKLYDIVHTANREGWKSERDIALQKWIAIGLVVGTLLAVVRALVGMRRRAIADATGLSPKPGLHIPYEQIVTIDNTQWRKKGIVTLTYRDAGGREAVALLDDYLLDNLPPLLEAVAERAKGAAVLSPPETGAAGGAAGGA